MAGESMTMLGPNRGNQNDVHSQKADDPIALRRRDPDDLSRAHCAQLCPAIGRAISGQYSGRFAHLNIRFSLDPAGRNRGRYSLFRFFHVEQSGR